jgi:hypothetical protein
VRRAVLCGALAILSIVSSAPSADAATPTISATWTTEVFATSARLRAEISPEGEATTYRFLYLVESAYLANLGAGREAFSGAVKAPPGLDPAVTGSAVVQSISGLTPETSYRYEVLATNPSSPAGGTAGPLRAFTTQALGGAPLLADGRGWEMVSPPEKDGGQIQGPGAISGGGVFQAAASGSQATYSSVASFGPEAQGAPRASQYLSSRGEAGWATQNITAPTLSGSYGAQPDGVPYQLFSPDLATALLLDGGRCGETAPCPTGYALRQSSGGALTPSPQAPDLRFAGAGPGLTHLVFSTCAALTATATEAAGGGGGCDPAEPNLYEWSGGSPQLINILPGQTEGTPGAALGAQGGAVSADGARVYWASAAGDVYLEEDGAGRPVDQSGEAEFQVSSEDGSVAYLLKAGDLYRYLAGNGALTDLTPAGGVTDVLGISADGSHVYYAGTQGVFLWDEGTTTEIAPGGSAALPSDSPPATGTSRVSADGSRLAFLSSAELGDYESRGDSEVYLYSAPAATLTCVSCDPTGERPRGPSSIPGAVANGTGPDATQVYKPRVLSAEGNRLFFDSEDALAVPDTNARPDVYEWEADGSGDCARPAGCINLISSGKASGGATFLDASEDGDDAFFLTDGSLVASDPGSTDVYDARVGGGFPIPPEPIACEGDSCQPLPSEPEDPSPGTLARGALNPPAPAPKAKKKPKKHHKKKHAKKQHKRHRKGGDR